MYDGQQAANRDTVEVRGYSVEIIFSV